MDEKGCIRCGSSNGSDESREGEKESTSRETLVDLEYKHSTVKQWKRRH